ncbi:hypothetical protein BpHYR1_001711 [Brachionus plicatilis]|uniref:Uncharacterized protein n=1 Tax=Brachionus plicatilis TaxID=10195 RepID=A0A3M7SZQ3_BRAPC|nr:hypothetical protein BpHYR1_001711 [Brachionus plicatilis]
MLELLEPSDGSLLLGFSLFKILSSLANLWSNEGEESVESPNARIFVCDSSSSFESCLSSFESQLSLCFEPFGSLR